VRILHGADDPSGHLLPRQIEVRVHGDADDIELRQGLVVNV
jgi:hypothetical protein